MGMKSKKISRKLAEFSRLARRQVCDIQLIPVFFIAMTGNRFRPSSSNLTASSIRKAAQALSNIFPNLPLARVLCQNRFAYALRGVFVFLWGGITFCPYRSAVMCLDTL